MPSDTLDHDSQRLRVWLLGGFRVAVGSRIIAEAEWRLRKARSLIKILALAPRYRLHREQVMELLWPDLEPQAAVNSLHQTLYVARRILAPHEAQPAQYLQLQDEILTLCPVAPLWVDVTAFETAAAQARQRQDLAPYRAALDHYTGDLLPDDRYEEWASARQETLRQEYLDLLRDLARQAEARADYALSIETLRRALASDPAHEEVQRALMRLYALTGQRQQALRQYQLLQDVLRRELDVEPDPHSQRLYQDILAGHIVLSESASETPLATVAAPTPAATESDATEPPAAPYDGSIRPKHSAPTLGIPHNLPAQLTSFIGRQREIAEAQRHLSTTRLLTLAGPGGCGKTRLALAVAANLLTLYPDGVWLIELAALADPTLVTQTVAAALGVSELVGQSLTEALTTYLKPRQLLLILDNCEHQVTACAQLSEVLLRSCPHLRILATSREPLHVGGEMIWLVPSLSLPNPHQLPPLEDLVRYEAIRLFVDRALAILPTFRMTEQNAATIAQVCVRLDGLPLAIELAAARMPVLTVEQLAGRLDDCFRLLTRGSRTALTRQQTLKATLDWSYTLLSEQEHILFRRLSAFAGGWTLEAAEAICAGAGLEHDDVLDVLSDLVAKSLVVTEEQGAAARYRMLETVRQYAAEKLREAGELARVRGQHLDFFLRLAEAADQKILGAERAAWLAGLEREHDNLRAALAWSLMSAEDAQSGLRLAGALFWFWTRRNLFGEARAWLDRLLAFDAKPEQMNARAKALYVAGELARYQADHAAARRQLEESAALGRALGDTWVVAAALNALGLVALAQGDYVAARASCAESVALFREVADAWYLALSLFCLGDATIAADPAASRSLYEESLALYRKLGDTWGAALPLTSLGRIALLEGDLMAAQTLLEESLAIRREMQSPPMIAISLNSLGDVVRCQGEYERAVLLYDEGLTLARELGTQSTIAWSLHNLGAAALAQGDAKRAVIHFAESIRLEQDIGSTPGIARSLAGLAGVAAAQGQPERAARLFGAAEALLGSIGATLDPADRLAYARDVATIRAQLGADASAAHWAMGRAMTLEQMIAEALPP